MPDEAKKPTDAAPNAAATEQPPEGSEATETDTQESQPETFPREYVEQLRRENAKYRVEAKKQAEEAERIKREAERAEMEEAERLKAELQDAKEALEKERSTNTTLQRRQELAGKVIDVDAALKLLDPDAHVKPDGTIDLDAFYDQHPFMRPQGQGKSAVPAGNPATSPKEGPLRGEDFRGKDPEWVRANLHRLKG